MIFYQNDFILSALLCSLYLKNLFASKTLSSRPPGIGILKVTTAVVWMFSKRENSSAHTSKLAFFERGEP